MPDSLVLPTGTVTFLYTDIEGSTKRWEQHPDAMKAAVERHDAILRGAIESNQGVVFRTMGDAFCAAFALASQALEAALSAQYALHAESWEPRIAPIKVRMGLHTGPGEVRDGDYVGPHLNRLARLLSTGYGGQVLLSQATYTLVCDSLPQGVDMLDLGEHQLRDLERAERVYQLVCNGLPSSFPPLKTENTQPNNLPILTTEFIGREKELDSVCELLTKPSVRLLTLTGAGGTGKTRLSLQAGATFLDKFQHGVFWVPLTAVSDPALVPGAIADALRITESGGRPVIDNLKDYLRQKELLLIIDNFEQVIGAAKVVSELLSAAAQVKVLVTSREVLHIYGEKEFPVPPLLLPDPQRLPPLEDLARYESIRLFVDRATSVKPGFELTAENGAALASICNRLDGLPLAIELAAARIKLLAPQALLSRLDSRLKLLTSGSRDLPARQQTLRGAIDWSYDLLPEPERAFFRRLAVFKGGCTLEAAEAIASGLQPEDAADGLDEPPGIDALDGLESLVDKSLLRHVESHDSDPRYLMLETIAEYAFERLMECGELDALRRRHAEYFLAVAERAEAGIQGPSQKSSIQVLVADHDNVRAVLQWSISDQGDKTVGLRIIYALYRFWHIRGHMSEGRRWAAALLSAAPERTQARARALYSTGYMAFLNGDPAEACTMLAESVEIAEELNDRLCLAHALFIYGAAKAFGGDPSGGRLLSERGISIFRQLGAEGKPGLNLALLATGVVIFMQGDYAAAAGVLEEARQIGTAIGDSYTRAQASTYLGDLARISCDYERAGDLYEESLAAFRAQGGRSDIPSSLHNIGYVALAAREYQRAWELFHESLVLQQEIGNQPGVLESLRGFAAVAGAQGDPLKAARLFGAAEALQSEMGAYLWPAERIECERNLSAARSRTDVATWQAAWKEGQGLNLEQAIDYALHDK